MELQIIQNRICEIRGYKVMLDFDLAGMYQVETKVLNQSVKRNINRFPCDFMFQLTSEEWKNLKSQIVTSKQNKEKRGGTRYLPFAFTEQGVAMLSSVLNSPLAIEVNISIMRAFLAIRNYMLLQTNISQEMEELWKAVNDLSEDNQKEFDDIYIALAELADKHKNESKPRNPIGFQHCG